MNTYQFQQFYMRLGINVIALVILIVHCCAGGLEKQSNVSLFSFLYLRLNFPFGHNHYYKLVDFSDKISATIEN